ncbi:MAG: hypothetical protein HYY06_20480 [Deltaproteobacteria bacterium]|nr:hypothetical protein [Deltaproteobacteria bacterium]
MIARSALAMAALGVVLGAAPPARSAAPEGYLDSARPNQIGGWARDPDHPGPIPVHIYIDGELAHDMLADGNRPDLPFADKDHGYDWTPPPLGPGRHEVIVYGIGVDANGAIDGENMGLTNSPSVISDGCNGFVLADLAWCSGVPAYFESRAADTSYLYNSNIRVGVDGSFGGTIFELYGAGHDRNLLTQHGGGAVQLSIWGYEPLGPDAWFAEGSCDPTAYATEEACRAEHASCRLWCCSEGVHVADCGAVRSCVDWGAGAPWNPIQAQGADCGWGGASNDVDERVEEPGSVFTRKTNPYHFTKSTAMEGVVFEQTTALFDAYVQIDYRVTYAGPYSFGPHPQEIPAVFPGVGMNHTYHFYEGDAPWSGAEPTTVVEPPSDAGLMFRLRDREPYPHSNVDHWLSESWVSACDESGASCLTVAVFSPQYREIAASGYPGSGYGYLTPLGGFALEPGFDESFTAYLFPARHDQVIAGRTVRDWIYDLAVTYGCLAHGHPCDDGDPCTEGDRCGAGAVCAGALTLACGGDAGAADAGGPDAVRDGEADRDPSFDVEDAGPRRGRSGGGCSCRVEGRARAPAAGLLALACVLGRRRGRRR